MYTKTFAVFFGSLVVVAVLLFLQVKGFLEPVKRGLLHAPRPVIQATQSVTRPVKSFFSAMFRLREISRENDRLRTQVFQLQEQLVKNEQQTRENDALRGELGFVKNTTLRLEPCSVLARNPLDLTDTIVLDCGTEKGVQEGDAVVSRGYLAGKILYAGDGTSTALLAVNSKFSTDARLSKSGSEGVVRGSFGSGLVLEQLSQNAEVEKGWLATTAGINEKIPKDILIGEVDEILSQQNDLFKKTTLVSPINFDILEFVFVVKP